MPWLPCLPPSHDSMPSLHQICLSRKTAGMTSSVRKPGGATTDRSMVQQVLQSAGRTLLRRPARMPPPFLFAQCSVGASIMSVPHWRPNTHSVCIAGRGCSLGRAQSLAFAAPARTSRQISMSAVKHVRYQVESLAKRYARNG